MKNKKNIILAVVICVVLFAAGIGIGLGIPSIKKSIDKKEVTEENVLDYIDIGDYKSLDVSIGVTKEDIEMEIDDLREQNTIYEQLEGTVADGDMVYADITGYVDGKRADDACTMDYVYVGSGEWLDGFEEALIGTKTGSTAEFTLSIPKGTFGDKLIDGNDLLYKVRIEYICGDPIVPEYNNDFVQSISDYNTVDEYNDYLKNKLLKENEADKAEFAWTELLSICKVKEYPESMMESARDEVLQGYYDMAELYGCSKDEVFQSFGYGSEDEFRESDLEELAKDTVKERLAAQGMAKLENITYAQEEYEAVVADEYSYNKDNYNSKEEYENKNKETLENIAIMNSVKSWLAENIKFSE